ncbi:TetR/AcrR family transcriptional regulator [Deminuibacter soli]|nr:TetR/AcrR family transcriptional regulator [Deminuibacter soli]
MRDRIQQKAEELFSRYGIRSVTMDEIAGQLGISKKTIYQSFEDKEELVAAVFEGHMNKSRDLCMADRDRSVNAVHEIFMALEMMEEILATMNPSILYDLEKYHPGVYQKFIEFKNSFMYTSIVENLERGIKEELYRADINVDVLARYRIANIMIAFNLDVFPKNKYKVVEVEEEILIHFLNGIVTPKGLKLLQKYIQQRREQKQI